MNFKDQIYSSMHGIKMSIMNGASTLSHDSNENHLLLGNVGLLKIKILWSDKAHEVLWTHNFEEICNSYRIKRWKDASQLFLGFIEDVSNSKGGIYPFIDYHEPQKVAKSIEDWLEDKRCNRPWPAYR